MPLQIVRNDITLMDVDAIICPANEMLVDDGGGVCNAIFEAAGQHAMRAACDALAPCRTGDAVVAPGFGLRARHVVFAVGPIWDDPVSCDEPDGAARASCGYDTASAYHPIYDPSTGRRIRAASEDDRHRSISFGHKAALLAKTYRNAIAAAVEVGAQSIAMPLISAGTFGCPVKTSFDIATEQARAALERDELDIYLVVYSRPSLLVGYERFGEIAELIDDAYVEEHRGRLNSVRLYEQRRRRDYAEKPRVIEETDRTPADRSIAGQPTTDQPAWDSVETFSWEDVSETSDDAEASYGRPDWGGYLRSPDALSAPSAARPAAPAAPSASRSAPSAAPSASSAPRSAAPSAARSAAPSAPSAPSAPRSAAPSAAPSAPSASRSAPSAAPSAPRSAAPSAAPSAPSSAAPSAPPSARKHFSRPSGGLGRISNMFDDLKSRLLHLDASFSKTLLTLIDERGMTDAEVYKRANISRQLFAKIRKDDGYRPTKQTAVALAVALGLDRAETSELIGRAGLAFSESSAFDVVVCYFIDHGVYDIDEINAALFAFDQPLLGSCA